MQVDPIKPTVKALGNMHLKLKYDILLSIFASILLSNLWCATTPRRSRWSAQRL